MSDAAWGFAHARSFIILQQRSTNTMAGAHLAGVAVPADALSMHLLAGYCLCKASRPIRHTFEPEMCNQ